jgi:Mor family transcriptional regulator
MTGDSVPILGLDRLEGEAGLIWGILFYRHDETPLPELTLFFQDVVRNTLDRLRLGRVVEADLASQAFVRFLDVFSGSEFAVPGPAELARAARDASIFSTLTGGGDVDPDVVSRLAARYGISVKRVGEIGEEVRGIVEHADLVRREYLAFYPSLRG